jgi:2-polyprenyl-3-methyl-5-hydroxy-6-metoxy-1,4-benzoquinol methylase
MRRATSESDVLRRATVKPSRRNIGALRQRVKDIRSFVERTRLSKDLRRNWRLELNAEDEASLIEALVAHYFSRWPAGYLETDEGRIDLGDHLYERLTNDRITIVPWLASILPLQGKTIIEIGCGTGTSSVALAEQGARIFGVDIDEGSLRVAEKRRRLYKIDLAEFVLANAMELQPEKIATADAVIFFACLEHMTLEEKLSSVERMWKCLKPGAFLAVVGTPNRLWWYDGHTSRLPFYNWLPDDLAIRYAKYSPREPFNTDLDGPIDDQQLLKLTRIGRAFGYHELELSIPDLADAKVFCMNRWMRCGNPIEFAKWVATGEASFERQLRRHGPRLDPAFFTPFLNLALRKPQPAT